MPRDRKSLEDHETCGSKPQYALPDSEVAASRPKYPKGISGDAKSAFKRLTKMLEQRRTITSGDQEILRLYAHLFDRHERALGHIRIEGEIIEYDAVSKSGEVYSITKENLWLAIAQNCETKMAQLLTQLGLTPRTRTQVKSTKDPKKTEDAFPSREEAIQQPTTDVDLLASINESEVKVN